MRKNTRGLCSPQRGEGPPPPTGEPPPVFRAKSNRSRRFIFGEKPRQTTLLITSASAVRPCVRAKSLAVFNLARTVGWTVGWPGRIFPNSITRVVPASGWPSDFSQSEAEDSVWLSGTGERYVQLLPAAHGGRSSVTNVAWGSVMLCASTVSRRVRRTWQSDA